MGGKKNSDKWGRSVSGKETRGRSTCHTLYGSGSWSESFSTGKGAGLVGGLIGLPGLGWPNSIFFIL